MKRFAAGKFGNATPQPCITPKADIGTPIS
jgi:hypothetical protein